MILRVSPLQHKHAEDVPTDLRNWTPVLLSRVWLPRPSRRTLFDLLSLDGTLTLRPGAEWMITRWSSVFCAIRDAVLEGRAFHWGTFVRLVPACFCMFWWS